ncbi:MAG: hypothetical protein J6Y20_07390 [Lachnospiraceae bacterium]|nr:hypothetical protein [Lachnospiraceae bacterium]
MTTEEVSKRRAELRALRERKGAEVGLLNEEISARKDYLKSKGIPVNSDERIIELRQRVTVLVGQLTEVNSEMRKLPQEVAKRKPLPHRPNGTGNPGTLFRNCTPFEQRILGLMIGEIGQERYRELLTIAKGDAKAKAPNPTARFCEMTHDDFDKMMRRNSNQFAGSEI